MLRLYFAIIISVLIIIPHTVNAFFLKNWADITATRNIPCRSDDNETSTNDFQFCAVRIYAGSNGTHAISFARYNGLRYLNTFRQFIKKGCTEFVYTLDEDVGIGSGFCGRPRSFETFSELQLCICATDNCNQNYGSCVTSNQVNINFLPLFDFMPSLIKTIQCDGSLNISNICQEHLFINVSLCEEYVRSNSVLCAITIYETQIIQTRLIYENYGTYLSKKIYQAKSALPRPVLTSFNETDTTVYYKLTYDPGYIEECACMNYPRCNQNINTCISQTPLQIETAMPTSSSTNNPSAAFTSEYSSSTSISTSAVITSADSATATTHTGSTTAITSIQSSTATTYIGSTTVITSIQTSTATTRTGSMTAITSIQSSTATTHTGSMTAITSIQSSTATTHTGSMTAITSIESTRTATSSVSTTATSFKNSITTATSAISPMTAMSSDSSTTASTPTTTLPSSTVTSSSVALNLLTGESGLGRSATAGIACGIIFSAVIFTAEIVFFKFFYSGNIASGFERSVAYRA